MRKLLVGLVVACAVVVGGGGVARGQCEGGFVDGPGQGMPGVNGTIYAMTEWDPDGDGPEGTWLVVGGNFTVAGGVLARNVAAWDGSRWRAMGAGLAGTPSGDGGGVSDLCVFNGQVYATGSFTTTGTQSGLMRWNDAAWVNVAGTVRADHFVVFNNELVCGGLAYNGVTVRAIGSQSGTSDKYAVGGGVLYKGTDDGVYRLNGNVWQRVYQSASSIRAILGYSGGVVISGWFDSQTAHDRILRFDGSTWTAMGSQVGLSAPGSFVELSGELYAGATVATSPTPSSRPLRWNGTGWVSQFGEDSACVSLLAVYRGELVGSLPFELRTSALAGGWPKRFAGEGMRSLGEGLVFVVGSNGSEGINCAADVGGVLYAGGAFRSTDTQSGCGVARRVSDRWEIVGGGVDGYGRLVSALQPFADGLVAGGSFSSAGGIPARSVSCWDGAAWSALGDGLAGPVYCLADWNNHLVAGGGFTQSGSRTVRRLAQWDGSSWIEMGGQLDASVNGAAVYNGDLYVCGGFGLSDGAGGTSCVARWDGAALVPVGRIAGPAYALCEHAGGCTSAGRI